MAHPVDRTALKVNQAFIVGLLFLAFLLGEGRAGPGLVALTALAMTIGAATPKAGPFFLVYLRLLRPLRLLKPSPAAEDPRPHRFALALGAAVTWVSALALLGGLGLAGWALAWVVIVLAFINLTVNF